MSTFDWAVRPAYTPLLGAATLRATPEDFQVEEVLGFEPSGDGEHLLVQIEKRGLTTQQAAQQLARAAGVRARNVGWAGLKDKAAVTRQTLSMPWPIKRGLPELRSDPSMQVLAVTRHHRKLRPGSHRANRFVIRCHTAAPVAPAELQARAVAVRGGGVPNAFGPQRFGRDGDNVAQFLETDPEQRCPGILISAARSLVFNAVLDARIADGTWNTGMAGEWMILDGSNSGFAAETDDAVLASRLTAFDIHPSGPLPGSGETVARGAVAKLETEIFRRHSGVVERLLSREVAADRRALRVGVPDLQFSCPADQVVELAFTLPPGSFATAVVDQFFSV